MFPLPGGGGVPSLDPSALFLLKQQENRCDDTIGKWIQPLSQNRTLPVGNTACRHGNCTTDNRTCTEASACGPQALGYALCLRYKQGIKNDTVRAQQNCTHLTQAPDGTNNTGYCLPCELGQYCPQGTITRAYSILENKCPAGSICETPDDIDVCPASTYCPQSTFFPGNKGLTICDKPGMYCPPGTPYNLDKSPGHQSFWCPAGHYCPNSTLSLPCPVNFFCWEGSLEPQPCGDSWDLTYSISRQQCATIGTSKAPQSWEGEVFVAVFAAMLVIVCVLNRLLQYYWASALRTKLDKSVSKLNQKLIKLVATGEGNLDVIGGGTNTNANVTDSFKPFPVRDGIMFSYKDLTLTVNAGGQPKVVVDRVSGEVPAATMTAVMGPSGAGKTSFMNVLCDRAGYGITTGSLSINGKEGDRISNHRDLMGFVPQDDIVHDELTVRENLMFAAINRLPLAKDRWCRTKMICSKEQRANYIEYVDQVLDLLQIAHVQDSIVGSVEKRGISGGQRKRVNIGLELVS